MDLTCELNGIKYLLVEDLIVENNAKKVEAKCKKFECIIQGISKVDRGGFFSNAYITIRILVPEKNVIAWNNELSA